jgi:hypothetical protein
VVATDHQVAVKLLWPARHLEVTAACMDIALQYTVEYAGHLGTL